METNSLIRFFLKLNKASLQKLCCIRNLRGSDKLHQEFGQSWWFGFMPKPISAINQARIGHFAHLKRDP